ASWGIEREQVFMEEILESPALLPLLKETTLKKVVDLFENILISKKSDNPFNKTNLQKIANKINSMIIDDILNLPSDGKVIVNDCLEYNLDLFHKQEKSIAFFPVLQEQVTEYGKIIRAKLDDFLEGQDLYANATVYGINRFTPLMMIKLSFNKEKKEIVISKEFVDSELKKLDQHLWEEKATNIYFRKKLNYKTGDDIYIIRPNQRRFWSQSMAIEDALELILEILNRN
ncbi:endonuclease, partial [candidate division KSB1 bacterium]|nr:endonuclease [candidate division KSB1 bacterium]